MRVSGNTPSKGLPHKHKHTPALLARKARYFSFKRVGQSPLRYQTHDVLLNLNRLFACAVSARRRRHADKYRAARAASSPKDEPIIDHGGGGGGGGGAKAFKTREEEISEDDESEKEADSKSVEDAEVGDNIENDNAIDDDDDDEDEDADGKHNDAVDDDDEDLDAEKKKSAKVAAVEDASGDDADKAKSGKVAAVGDAADDDDDMKSAALDYRISALKSSIAAFRNDDGDDGDNDEYEVESSDEDAEDTDKFLEVEQQKQRKKLDAFISEDLLNTGGSFSADLKRDDNDTKFQWFMEGSFGVGSFLSSWRPWLGAALLLVTVVLFYCICTKKNKKLKFIPMNVDQQCGQQPAPAWSLAIGTQPSSRFAPSQNCCSQCGQWGAQCSCSRNQFCASAAGGYPQFAQATASAGGCSPMSSDTQQQGFFTSGAPPQSGGLFAPQQFSSAGAAPSVNAYASVPQVQGTFGGFNAQQAAQSGVPMFDLTGSIP